MGEGGDIAKMSLNVKMHPDQETVMARNLLARVVFTYFLAE